MLSGGLNAVNKYKFTAVLLVVIVIIYVICNDVCQGAGMLLAKHGIKAMGCISMPVYGYVSNLEKNEENAAVKVTDGIYPVNEYARDRYITEAPLSANRAKDGETSVSDSNGSDNGSSGSNGAGNNDKVSNGAESSVGNSSGGNSDSGSVNTSGDSSGSSSENGTDKIFGDGYVSASQPAESQNNTGLSAVASNNVITGMVYPKANLDSYNFVLNNFYTVTGITELGSDKLRPSEFLKKDMKITHDASTPQILIFHTHSQEAFCDSTDGDTSTTIVGVGEYLARILREKYGYNVIHDTSVYDLVNGKLDRSKAYTYAEESVAKILEENPSIEVVIDLHRDGVPESTRLVSDINGKKTAKIMFFNGLSYSRVNGDISYLANPYRDDNLAMSLQMQLLGNAYYPGFLRRIYVNAYRYCLHMRGKSMLIEAGAQTNTVEEVMNAMEPLADLMDKTLKGEKCW